MSHLFCLLPLFICLIIYVGKVKFLKRFCVQSCTQVFQCLIVGCWVGFGCGWVKLNVLQKRWLVCRLAALLILRSVGILSTVFLFVCCRLCRPLHLQLTGLGLLTLRLYEAVSCPTATRVIENCELQNYPSSRSVSSPMLAAVIYLMLVM